MSMNQRLARVSEIIDAHGSQPSQLIAILQDTQSAFNYLSQEDMTLIAHLRQSESQRFIIIIHR